MQHRGQALLCKVNAVANHDGFELLWVGSQSMSSCSWEIPDALREKKSFPENGKEGTHSSHPTQAPKWEKKPWIVRREGLRRVITFCKGHVDRKAFKLLILWHERRVQKNHVQWDIIKLLCFCGRLRRKILYSILLVWLQFWALRSFVSEESIDTPQFLSQTSLHPQLLLD